MNQSTLFINLTLGLSFLTLCCLSGPAAGNESASGLRHFRAESARAQAPAEFAVSRSGPNRIAVTGEKIINAIYDQSQLDVQTDANLGQIYAIVKTQNPVSIFLTTDKNTSYAATLVPAEVPAQNIVLEGQPKVSVPSAPIRQIAIETAPNTTVGIKNLTTTILRGQTPEGFTVTNRCGKGCIREWRSATYAARMMRIQSTNKTPKTLAERDFWQPGVLAVALSQSQLRMGEVGQVLIISRLAPATDLEGEPYE